MSTTTGTVAAAWIFGALFLEGGGASAVSALAAPAAVVAAWLSVARARDPGPRRESLYRYFIGIAHPLSVLVLAICTSAFFGGGRGLPDLVWTMAVTLTVYALASRHREHQQTGEVLPSLRRITILGIALLAVGQIIFHIPDLLLQAEIETIRWWRMEADLESSAVCLALAIGAISGGSVLRVPKSDSLPLEWPGALAVLWVWAAGWTGASGTGLLLPALAISAAVLLSPLFAPRPLPTESLETGSVATGMYLLVAAWAAALIFPGTIPDMVGAPESGVTVLRFGLVALLAYQVRDLIAWGLIVRLAPSEQWTGALWIVWMVVSWVIGGAGLREIGASWPIAAILGFPWGAFIMEGSASGMIESITAASLFSTALFVGIYAWLARNNRRAFRNR